MRSLVLSAVTSRPGSEIAPQYADAQVVRRRVAQYAVLSAGRTVIAALSCRRADVDFGTSIYAGYRLARSVRETAHLGFDPFVAIIAFPLIPRRATQYDNWRSKPWRSTVR